MMAFDPTKRQDEDVLTNCERWALTGDKVLRTGEGDPILPKGVRDGTVLHTTRQLWVWDAVAERYQRTGLRATVTAAVNMPRDSEGLYADGPWNETPTKRTMSLNRLVTTDEPWLDNTTRAVQPRPVVVRIEGDVDEDDCRDNVSTYVDPVTRMEQEQATQDEEDRRRAEEAQAKRRRFLVVTLGGAYTGADVGVQPPMRSPTLTPMEQTQEEADSEELRMFFRLPGAVGGRVGVSRTATSWNLPGVTTAFGRWWIRGSWVNIGFAYEDGSLLVIPPSEWAMIRARVEFRGSSLFYERAVMVSTPQSAVRLRLNNQGSFSGTQFAQWSASGRQLDLAILIGSSTRVDLTRGSGRYLV